MAGDSEILASSFASIFVAVGLQRSPHTATPYTAGRCTSFKNNLSNILNTIL